MGITATIALIGSGLSILVALTAIAKFFDLRRQAVLDEGRRREVIEQLRRDIDHAYEKIHATENNSRQLGIDITELKTDVKHILKFIEEIRGKSE